MSSFRNTSDFSANGGMEATGEGVGIAPGEGLPDGVSEAVAVDRFSGAAVGVGEAVTRTGEGGGCCAL